jgi:adenylate kinase family enzyme
MRIHILGASGCGTTTLGMALAERLGVAHVDTDSYFWEPTRPPFQTPRPRAERQTLLAHELDAHAAWVLSGSLCGWGDVFIPRFDAVVFLRLSTEIRLARLRERELARFGEAALAPGGAMHENHREFLDWAAAYDDGDLSMRSLTRHREWLERLPCPVLRLEGVLDVDEEVGRVVASLAAGRMPEDRSAKPTGGDGDP